MASFSVLPDSSVTNLIVVNALQKMSLNEMRNEYLKTDIGLLRMLESA
jgi:hypothetical protein